MTAPARINAFTVECEDTPDAPVLRKAHLAAHMAWVETVMDKVLVAGPRYENGVGAGPTASFTVLLAADEAEAQAIAEADPYWKAGVWKSQRIRPFCAAAGSWLGGKTW